MEALVLLITNPMCGIRHCKPMRKPLETWIVNGVSMNEAQKLLARMERTQMKLLGQTFTTRKWPISGGRWAIATINKNGPTPVYALTVIGGAEKQPTIVFTLDHGFTWNSQIVYLPDELKQAFIDNIPNTHFIGEIEFNDVSKELVSDGVLLPSQVNADNGYAPFSDANAQETAVGASGLGLLFVQSVKGATRKTEIPTQLLEDNTSLIRGPDGTYWIVEIDHDTTSNDKINFTPLRLNDYTVGVERACRAGAFSARQADTAQAFVLSQLEVYENYAELVVSIENVGLPDFDPDFYFVPWTWQWSYQLHGAPDEYAPWAVRTLISDYTGTGQFRYQATTYELHIEWADGVPTSVSIIEGTPEPLSFTAVGGSWYGDPGVYSGWWKADWRTYGLYPTFFVAANADSEENSCYTKPLQPYHIVNTGPQFTANIGSWVGRDNEIHYLVYESDGGGSSGTGHVPYLERIPGTDDFEWLGTALGSGTTTDAVITIRIDDNEVSFGGGSYYNEWEMVSGLVEEGPISETVSSSWTPTAKGIIVVSRRAGSVNVLIGTELNSSTVSYTAYLADMGNGWTTIELQYATGITCAYSANGGFTAYVLHETGKEKYEYESNIQTVNWKAENGQYPDQYFTEGSGTVSVQPAWFGYFEDMQYYTEPVCRSPYNNISWFGNAVIKIIPEDVYPSISTNEAQWITDVYQPDIPLFTGKWLGAS